MHFTVNLKCKNAYFCGIKSKLEMVTNFYWFMIIDLETNATGSILNDFNQKRSFSFDFELCFHRTDFLSKNLLPINPCP